ELEAEEEAAAEEGAQLLPLPGRLRSPDTLADVVQANCLEPDGGGEDEHVFWARRRAAERAAEAAAGEVAAAGEAGGAEGGGAQIVPPSAPRPAVLGLWPPAAYLNHSCMPNTLAYLVGDTLFLRASRKISRDSELTLSYLPAGAGGAGGVAGGGGTAAAPATLLSPLAERRAALAGGWGFQCGCSRCRGEAALDPKLRALMADVTAGVVALREELETALAIAEMEEGAGGEEEEEAEEAAEEEVDEEEEGEDEGGEQEEEEDEGGDGGRWREQVGSIADRAGLFVELLDAAMAKLRLSGQQQITAQSAVVPLYTLLWAALGARGELEPRLAELVAALVGEVTPGSADHLWWSAVALETAEMIVAEEKAEEEEAAALAAAAAAPSSPSAVTSAPPPAVRQGSSSSSSGGGGFGGGGGGRWRRPADDRVVIADRACYKAFSTRYGPISRGVYQSLLLSRRQREDEAAAAEAAEEE
ncbi:hypothetical protein Agub_g13425, partial [Astrephomene gubernaculifera]